jgi:hypothetical protein
MMVAAAAAEPLAPRHLRQPANAWIVSAGELARQRGRVGAENISLLGNVLSLHQ